MSTALLVIKTAIFFAGIAAAYVALTWPLFSRRLVYGENEVPFPGQEKNPAGVKTTRRFLLSLTVFGWCAAAGLGYSLHALMAQSDWLNYGMPFSMGCAFTMLAGPLRLWHRMRPWSA